MSLGLFSQRPMFLNPSQADTHAAETSSSTGEMIHPSGSALPASPPMMFSSARRVTFSSLRTNSSRSSLPCLKITTYTEWASTYTLSVSTTITLPRSSQQMLETQLITISMVRIQCILTRGTTPKVQMANISTCPAAALTEATRVAMGATMAVVHHHTHMVSIFVMPTLTKHSFVRKALHGVQLGVALTFTSSMGPLLLKSSETIRQMSLGYQQCSKYVCSYLAEACFTNSP